MLISLHPSTLWYHMTHHMSASTALTALVSLTLGCASAPRADVAIDTPTDASPDTSAEATPGRDVVPTERSDADYTMRVGEMLVVELDRAAAAPYQPTPVGVVAYANGDKLALIALSAGFFDVQIDEEASGDVRTLNVLVKDEGPLDALDEHSSRFENLGVGSVMQFDLKGFSSVSVVESDSLDMAPTPDDRMIRVTMRSPGTANMLFMSREGGNIKRVVFETLPLGQIPDGAELHELEVGGPGHRVDLADAREVTVATPGVARVEMLEGNVALIEPLAQGLAAVTFFRGLNQPRTIWFRVSEPE